jgi:hypothetical protein
LNSEDCSYESDIKAIGYGSLQQIS